jgi:hypothetical protein
VGTLFEGARINYMKGKWQVQTVYKSVLFKGWVLKGLTLFAVKNIRIENSKAKKVLCKNSPE